MIFLSITVHFLFILYIGLNGSQSFEMDQQREANNNKDMHTITTVDEKNKLHSIGALKKKL